MFFNRTNDLKRNITSCTEVVKYAYSSNLSIPKAICDELESFCFRYTSYLKNFGKLAEFDIESNFVVEETCQDTHTAIWTEKHIPMLCPLL